MTQPTLAPGQRQELITNLYDELDLRRTGTNLDKIIHPYNQNLTIRMVDIGRAIHRTLDAQGTVTQEAIHALYRKAQNDIFTTVGYMCLEPQEPEDEHALLTIGHPGGADVLKIPLRDMEAVESNLFANVKTVGQDLHTGVSRRPDLDITWPRVLEDQGRYTDRLKDGLPFVGPVVTDLEVGELLRWWRLSSALKPWITVESQN